MMRLLRTALLVLPLAACMDGSSPPEEQPCGIDEDCGAAGLVCALGTCADPDDPRLGAVDLAVAPPASSGLVAQQVFGVQASGVGRVDVALRETANVTGTVKTFGDEGAGARVVATATETIQGKAGSLLAVAEPMEGTFQLDLVDGRSYAVKVYPDDGTLPPVYVEPPLLAEVGGDLVVALPDPASLVLVSGVVQARGGGTALGIPDLQVALTWGSVVVSSTARTAADGSFTLAVAPGFEEALTLLVRSTAENPLWPSVVVLDLMLDATLDVGTVDLGEIGAPVPFHARVLDAEQKFVGGATIHVRALLGKGVFETSFVSNVDDGTVDAQLPAGAYVMSVVPPVGSSAGALLGTTQTIDADTPTVTLRVPPRTEARGVVTDAGGVPVAEAAVTLARMDCAGVAAEPSLAGATWSFEATTDAQGEFSAAVDPGCYRLQVAPATGAGLPRHARVVAIDEAGSVLEVQLDPGALLAGAVVDAAGQPVSGALVQAFSRLPTGDGVAFSLGDGITGADGTFSVVIPDLAQVPAQTPAE